MNELLATEHLLAVAVIVVGTAALVVAARLRPGPWTTSAARVLAVILVGAEVGWWIYLIATHANRSELLYALPFQLCDAAIFVAALALWFRRQLLVEITYFWGLAGTIQAIFTPDLPPHFPTFPFIQYYLAHGGVVGAALFLVVGLGRWPRRNAYLWVAALTIAYAAVVGLLDFLTGADYLYLRVKPASATLLDAMGPWPWYIGWAALVGIALFAILDAPFRILRRREGRTRVGADNQI
ncbi:MAG TPA: TIGR02206 family membrane protein [Candidatus Dormibacteraeota bacterium]|nr:TIGR02206 family membrane protein [Candidatus Dormibacteraeota bacterium]